MAGTGLHQQDRDGLRHQPQRVVAGAEDWMQFIPSTWRPTVSMPTTTAGRIRTTRSTRSALRPLPEGRRWRSRHPPSDPRLQPRRLVRRRGPAGAQQYGAFRMRWSARSQPHRGAHFPVAANARYADDINDAAALARSTTQRKAAGNAADVIQSDASRRSINIYSRWSPGHRQRWVIKKMAIAGPGNFIVLEDAYGNRYTYSNSTHFPDASGASSAEAGRRRLQARGASADAPRCLSAPSPRRIPRPSTSTRRQCS